MTGPYIDPVTNIISMASLWLVFFMLMIGLVMKVAKLNAVVASVVFLLPFPIAVVWGFAQYFERDELDIKRLTQKDTGPFLVSIDADTPLDNNPYTNQVFLVSD